MRSGLRKWLVKVCEREGIPITWNCRALTFIEEEDTIKVLFEDGEPQEFDILIGGKIFH